MNPPHILYLKIFVIPCSSIISLDKTRMSQESSISSPPGSGRSKRSREAYPSVAFANSIQGSANPSMQSTPVTPMPYPSAQESAILRIQETIVTRQNELDKINMDLSEIKIKLKETSGVGMEKAEEYLRFEHQTLLTRLTQVGAEIQSLRELELRKTAQVAGTASMAREAGAGQGEYRFGNAEKVKEIIESLQIEGTTQIPKIAQMFTLRFDTRSSHSSREWLRSSDKRISERVRNRKTRCRYAFINAKISFRTI